MEIETFDLVDSSVCEQIGTNDKNSKYISWFRSHFRPHSRFANDEISPKKLGNGGTHIKYKMEQIAYPKLPGFTPCHEPIRHDPNNVVNKRRSATQQEKNADYVNQRICDYKLPRRPPPPQAD